MALCPQGGTGLEDEAGWPPHAASFLKTWLWPTVICLSHQVAGPLDQFLRAHRDDGFGQCRDVQAADCRLCLGDSWNPWSSLALGEFRQKPLILQAGGLEKRSTGDLEPSSRGLPLSMALSTA